MATSKELRALIVLAGRVDPSLQSAMLRASGESKKLAQNAEKSVKSLNKVAGSVKSAIMGSAMTLAGLAAAAFSANKIIDTADAWTTVRSRVGLATESIEQQEETLTTLFNVAQRTKQTYQATSDLYTKIAMNADELGISNEKILSLTDTVNKALRIGGGTTQQNEAAIMQFSQALASGVLQGDELRSMLENAPRLTKAIAEGMGVTVGSLKKLGSEGELTSEKIIKALESQAGTLDKEFGKIPTTIRGALTYADNAFGKFIDDVGKKTKIFDYISQGIIKAVDKTTNYLNTHYINNPEFQNLPDIQSKITFVIDDLLKSYNDWLANGGQEQLNKMGKGLIDILATSLEAGAPRLAQAGLILGKSLGEAIWKALVDSLKPSAKDWEMQPWLRNLLGQGGTLIQRQEVETRNILGVGSGNKNNDPTPEALLLYGSGGIATKPSIFGDDGPEIAIPLKQTQRSLDLLALASRILTPKNNKNPVIKNYLEQTATITGPGLANAMSGSESQKTPPNVYITINASPDNAKEIASLTEETLLDVFERYFGEKARVSFG